MLDEQIEIINAHQFEAQWYASGIEHKAKIGILEGACLAIHNCSIFMTVENGVKVLSFKVQIS